MFEKITGYV